MEIEAAGDAIDVEDFTGEVEVWDGLAFHRFKVEIIQRHSAAGDKFFFVETFAGDFKFGCGQFVGEAFRLLPGEVCPGRCFGDPGGFGEALPKSAGDAFDNTAFFDFSFPVFVALFREFLLEGIRGLATGPIDFEVEVVIDFREFPGSPRRGFEGGWAAESPVGDEERALRLDFSGAERGVGH